MQSDLSQWVLQQLDLLDWQGSTEITIAPIEGDAGFRRYYRVSTSPPLLAVEAPVSSEDSHAFIHIAGILRKNDVKAPTVVASDLERGFLLVEDLGSRLYLDVLSKENADELYGNIFTALLKIQQCPRPDRLPDYNADRLVEEMSLCKEWFVSQLLGYTLNADENAMFNDLFDQLVASACEQPTVFVHRDFHSRNLVVPENPASEPGIIDFQDAVWGPVTYDLVSLLRDCYISWPDADVENWVEQYRQKLVNSGVIESVGSERFKRWFDWMGLQRHIKVLGIFARLWLRDGKSGYLQDLPLVIHYTVTVAEGWPELSGFAQWFRHNLMPLIKEHPWYRTHIPANTIKQSNQGGL